MLEIQLTETFKAWLFSLRDLKGRVAIARRLERAALGNFGDMKTVGGN